jgi:hypothetical protein
MKFYSTRLLLLPASLALVLSLPAWVQLLTDGMEIFVGVLGNVVSGIGQERH